MDPNKIVVGVCAMEKKSRSKPMSEIKDRLEKFHEKIQVTIFDEKTIMENPVEDWPFCHCLLSFYSREIMRSRDSQCVVIREFPLDKTIDYIKLRAPYLINNVEKQFDLLDRTKIFRTMQEAGLAVPRYAVIHRNSDGNARTKYVEAVDYIEINGTRFTKPFVEKPISAEDHDINIYHNGGGVTRLFRKANDVSSEFVPEKCYIRKDRSYIYEDFIQTRADVKVYAVGPYYAHAEARKSPGLDGVVDRENGREKRSPVILTNFEKDLARRIVFAFKQNVCGFDILRSNGKSYVCDVNGFSFVKTSTKYYDDCARILGNVIMANLASNLSISWTPSFQMEDPPIVSTTYGKMMELRCVIGVIRHGDRTPKQKLKMVVKGPLWFDLFKRHIRDTKKDQIKLKHPLHLQEVLHLTRQILKEDHPDKHINHKIEQLKLVLEMYGHFSGINRKLQIKYLTQRQQSTGSLTGCLDSSVSKTGSLLVIMKWGGELTPAGCTQAEELGKAFRCLYPGNYPGDTQGLGFLRLHNTYRHDLKIYASDEGRVQTTAAAFAKGLLALDGKLKPIMTHMVKSANTDGLLDDIFEAKACQQEVKERLHNWMQQDKALPESDAGKINATNQRSIGNALKSIKNPGRMCEMIHALSLRMLRRIRRLPAETNGFYLKEPREMVLQRWKKLVNDFRTKRPIKDEVTGEVAKFDISKIPDIYDCVKYDLQHNYHLIRFKDMEELYLYSKYMADVVVPQEYGITKEEKLTIGKGICVPLISKIKADLLRCVKGDMEEENITRLDPRKSQNIGSPFRHIRTRLYFTSEGHIHSLMNLLYHGELKGTDDATDAQWERAKQFLSLVAEYNYMSQLVIMLYEDPSKSLTSDQRFHVEIHFSPGVLPCVQTTHVPGLGYRPKKSESTPIPGAMIKELQACLSKARAIDQERKFGKDRATTTDDEVLNSITIETPVRIVAIDTSRSHITKANSDGSAISCHPSPRHSPMPANITDSEDDEANNYNSNIVSIEEKITGDSTGQGYRSLPRFSLARLLRENRGSYEGCKLISTTLIDRQLEELRSVEALETQLLLATAVAPNPSKLSANHPSGHDRLTTAFPERSDVPPVRSLETLHNHLSHREVDQLLDRLISGAAVNFSLSEKLTEAEMSNMENNGGIAYANHLIIACSVIAIMLAAYVAYNVAM